MDLQGRRALVTGASSGIGRAAAEALAAKGVTLAIAGRREDALRDTAGAIVARGGERPVVVAVDLSQPEGARGLAARVLETLGGIDILINNAGEFEAAYHWEDGVPTRERQVFETNYWSPIALVRTFVPGMRARGRGAIVNVSSLSTIAPMPGMGQYPQSKGALALATQMLRMELRGSGVNVLLALLGPVDTPMHHKAALSHGAALRYMTVGKPGAVADRIVRAIERERTALIYPRSIIPAWLFPGPARWITESLVVPWLFGKAAGMQGQVAGGPARAK
jgi:short-subunit dehydrogenase